MSRLGNSFEFFKEVAENSSDMAEGYVMASEDYLTDLKDMLTKNLPASMIICEIKEYIKDRKRYINQAKKVLPE